jgi:DNA repair protein RadC
MKLLLETRTAAGYSLQDRDLLFSEQPDQYVLRFKDLPDDERPRERLLAAGPAELSLAELVAIVWGSGTRKEDVLAMARRTLKEYGDKTIGQELDPRHLSETAGIPLTRACQIIASFELGRRFYARQAGRSAYIRNAKQAFQYLKSMGHGQKEQLRGLYLNSRYQVIHDEIISVGSLTANIVHPREVFQPAIEHSAIALILAHNHPSGRLEPTLADIQITEQLITAGEVLGIDLLDHLVITGTKYISVMDCLKHD